MTQTFIDTIVVCSMTGFVIISTGLWSCGKTGAALTSSAFAHSLPFGIGGMIVAIGLILFAYSTLLGWCYYGEKSIQYLFGIKSVKPYRIVFVVIVAIGAIVHLEFVWTVSDIMNGLMAFPNLVGLIGLYKIVVDETGYYFRGHFNR
jgi:AGCS family alanine or glycine:cation symporter